METQTATRLLTAAIAARAMPGAVYVAGNRDGILAEAALGRLAYDADAPPVTPETIYDLASLTKVLVTTPLAMRLYEHGQLDLEAPVQAYVPEFSGGEKGSVLVADLLAHCGGLRWWRDLFRAFEGRSAAESKRGYIDSICELPLDYPPRSRSVYSDLGFMLLGEILERLTRRPLDRVAREEIFAPLGMHAVAYNPPQAWLPRIAPTENDPWRGGVLKGTVHDENAFGLGGIAPHAGLFSSARAIVPFARMFLNAGALNGERVFAPDTVRRFTARAHLVANSSRALGWDTPTAQSSCGSALSAAAHGHTGFTGTSLWIDPQRDFFVALLTNRVHPTRDNPKLAALRPRFHEVLAKGLRVG